MTKETKIITAPELQEKETKPLTKMQEKKASAHYVNNKELFEALVVWKKDIRRAARKGLPKPPLPDFIAECMMKIADRLSKKAGFVNYCYDTETQVLSQRGWLGHEDLRMDDIVLSCDPNDLTLKWGPVLDIYRANYKGKMFHLTGNGLDALVTPHHKFLTLERGLVPVENLHQREHLVLMGNPVVNVKEPIYSDSFVKLVGWAVTEGSYYEGKNSSRIVISQKKDVGIADILDALEGTGAEYSRHIVTEDHWRDYMYVTDDGRVLTSRYSDKGKNTFTVKGQFAKDIIAVSPNRVLTSEFIRSLTHEQRILLIDTMICGDGNTFVRKTGTLQRYYYQKDKAHMDAFVSLCTQSGIKVSERLTTVESSFGKSQVWQTYLSTGYSDPHLCYMENVDMHGAFRKLTQSARGALNYKAKLTDEQVLEAKLLYKQGGTTYKKLGVKYGMCAQAMHRIITGKRWKHLCMDIPQKEHVPTVPYDGKIWCLTTNYGTAVVKRNGKIYVNSQSYREDFIGDSLESCVRYIENFNPKKSNNPFSYISQICGNSFIRRIQKEQKQQYIKHKIIEQSDYIDSYERQDTDISNHNNNYLNFLKENQKDVITKFEDWKERKKQRAAAKKAETAANLNAIFEEKQAAKEAKKAQKAKEKAAAVNQKTKKPVAAPKVKVKKAKKPKN